jgi:hypothetical protein
MRHTRARDVPVPTVVRVDDGVSDGIREGFAERREELAGNAVAAEVVRRRQRPAFSVRRWSCHATSESERQTTRTRGGKSEQCVCRRLGSLAIILRFCRRTKAMEVRASPIVRASTSSKLMNLNEKRVQQLALNIVQ